MDSKKKNKITFVIIVILAIIILIFQNADTFRDVGEGLKELESAQLQQIEMTGNN